MHFFTEPHTRKYVSNNQSLTKSNMKRLFLFYTNAVLSVLPTGLATRRRSITALVAHAFSLLAHSWGHGPELPPAVRLHASVLCRRCPCDFAISRRPVISLLSAFRHHRGFGGDGMKIRTPFGVKVFTTSLRYPRRSRPVARRPMFTHRTASKTNMSAAPLCPTSVEIPLK